LTTEFLCLTEQSRWYIKHMKTDNIFTATMPHAHNIIPKHLFVSYITNSNILQYLFKITITCSHKKHRIFPTITHALPIQKHSVNGKKWRCALCN
jgi:hypothetical protein